jgi:hypothetical protein
MTETRRRRAVVCPPGDLKKDDWVEAFKGRRAGMCRGKVLKVSDSKVSCWVRDLASNAKFEFRMCSLRRVPAPTAPVEEDLEGDEEEFDDGEEEESDVESDVELLPVAEVVKPKSVVTNIETAEVNWPDMEKQRVAIAAGPDPVRQKEKLGREITAYRLVELIAADKEVSHYMRGLCMALARQGFDPDTPFQDIFSSEMYAAQVAVAAEFKNGQGAGRCGAKWV